MQSLKISKHLFDKISKKEIKNLVIPGSSKQFYGGILFLKTKNGKQTSSMLIRIDTIPLENLEETHAVLSGWNTLDSLKTYLKTKYPHLVGNSEISILHLT